MRGSRWLILAVVVVVVGVTVAKENIKARRSEQVEALGEAARGPQSRGDPSTGSGSPRAESRGEAENAEAPDGPLPGSALAECLHSGRPTMADFGKEWCVPCKAMVPVLKQAAQDYRGKANIVFVNLEEDRDLGLAYRISVMPTQVFFDAEGREVKRHMGYMSAEEVARELAALGVKR